MESVTLRKLPPEVAKMIRAKAEEDRTSLNRAVIRLLEEVAGTVRRKKPLYHELDHLAGSWNEEEAKAFEEALESQRTIDEDLWK
jgi:hypothetical protein